MLKNHQPSRIEVGSAAGMYSLRDIFDALGGSFKFEELLNRILSVVVRELAADQGSLLLLEGEDNPSLKMLATHGLPPDIVRRGYVPRKGSISEYVIRERRPLILNDSPRSKQFEPLEAGTQTPRRIASALCAPLVARDLVIGTLNINRIGNGRQFSEEDLETCSIVATQAAIVIENRRLQLELLQNERLAAVGMTVAGISHCVKNILTGLRGGISITEMGLKKADMEQVHEGFGMLKRNSTIMSNLVLDLLDYSKDREPAREYFELASLLRNVIQTVSHKAEANGVLVEEEIPSEIDCYGDQDQIFRAILNLATNAIEACASSESRIESAPRVEIGFKVLDNVDAKALAGNLTSDGSWIAIWVSDNGPGIPEEARSRIWDLFFSTKGSKGTGIGLAASSKMIEEHGGKIVLESSPDVGSTFTVLLPQGIAGNSE